MYPQIIKCPSCNTLFKLHHKPSKIFICSKCQYKTQFSEILKVNDSHVTQHDEESVKNTDSASNTVGEATKVFNFGEKTKLVPGLQQPQCQTAMFNISFRNVTIGNVTLPKSGTFNLGRRSSDSTAHIKLAPDMTMSRVHAAMRTVLTKDGNVHYQITTIKPENPVYVNDEMIEKGKIRTLKHGDKIRLGDTVLTFIFN